MLKSKIQNPIRRVYDAIHHGGRSFYNYIDSIMNTTLGERFNVFYFLGTIPIFLIFVLLITGLYMFIFYGLSVDNTYNSVKYITEEAPLGRVIRGIHRYSANFMVFFIILHMVRTFVEGKYQNHRRLAWITGVILLFFTLTEGITGYMMALNTTSHYILTKTSELFA
ncbi:MAG: cytochrome b N-terminal domain-containing protein, partial [Spirochaetota bacterium]|nr:cytochrome b N-terminal domain-containing protein [Spirochaetota bacterium]